MDMQSHVINRNGSEWDNVLVFEENFPYNKEEHKRWLYTACTREKKKLVVVKA